MKISKILLTTILASITAGTITSCEKEKDEQAEKIKKEQTDKQNTGDNCPGCGMG